MPETIKWNFQTSVVGGPTMVAKGELQVDAYTKLDVLIPASGSQTIEILTGGGGPLQLLVITPKTQSRQLSYSITTEGLEAEGPEVEGPEAEGPEAEAEEEIILDGPHVLIGGGAVGLLSSTVGSLTFTNGDSQPASIAILAGRDATP